MTLDRFTEFLALLPTRADSERSWTVTRDELEKRRYDLKAVNPHARNTDDDRSPGGLLKVLNEQNAALQTALEKLRGLL